MCQLYVIFIFIAFFKFYFGVFFLFCSLLSLIMTSVSSKAMKQKFLSMPQGCHLQEVLGALKKTCVPPFVSGQDHL